MEEQNTPAAQAAAESANLAPEEQTAVYQPLDKNPEDDSANEPDDDIYPDFLNPYPRELSFFD